MAEDAGSLRLMGLVGAVWTALLGFYGFLGYRARLWSPSWAISPTVAVFPIRAAQASGAAARGRVLYRALRCGVCHGADGEGGVVNPNADSDPAGTVPSLRGLAEAFGEVELKEKIRRGARTQKADEAGPEPPLDMPAWERGMTPEQLDDLTRYLLSLEETRKDTERRE